MDYSPPSSPEAPCIAATASRASSLRSWRNPLNRLYMHHEENVRVEKEERTSLMFAALPASIQNRLPPIPSFRRTVTMPTRSSIIPFSSSSASGSGTGTGLGLRSGASSPPLSEADTEIEHHDDIMEGLDFGTTRNFISTLGVRVPEPEPEDESSVDWRYAKQGLDLVITSGRECRRPARSGISSKFERSTYVTGVGYLLDGLPRNLDDTEIMLLQRSMPGPLAESPDLGEPTGSRRRGCGRPQQQQRAPPAQRNLVRMIVFHVLMWAQAWICWAMPHILYFMGETMRLEREYKVTQTLLSIANTCFNAIRGMSDGVAGQFVGYVFHYATKGVEDALKDFVDSDVRNRGARDDRDGRPRGYARRR